MSFEDTESLDESSTFNNDIQSEQNNESVTNAESFTQKANSENISSLPVKDIDQEFYSDILEKLDIKRKDIQEKTITENTKKTEGNSNKNVLEIALSQDFDKIQKLIKAGLINSQQGQNLKKQVLKKAFDKLVQAEKIKRAGVQESRENNQIANPVNLKSTLDEFSQNNPNFFSSSGRQEVLNYLQSGGAGLELNELNKISNLIRTVEKSAIDRYLQKIAHEKTIRNSNENAKERLVANAQKSGVNNILPKSFTREQIGKMSPSEFNKYEASIMEALKKGQIR